MPGQCRVASARIQCRQLSASCARLMVDQRDGRTAPPSACSPTMQSVKFAAFVAFELCLVVTPMMFPQIPRGLGVGLYAIAAVLLVFALLRWLQLRRPAAGRSSPLLLPKWRLSCVGFRPFHRLIALADAADEALRRTGYVLLRKGLRPITREYGWPIISLRTTCLYSAIATTGLPLRKFLDLSFGAVPYRTIALRWCKSAATGRYSLDYAFEPKTFGSAYQRSGKLNLKTNAKQ
jgi:hypothetical protein